MGQARLAEIPVRKLDECPECDGLGFVPASTAQGLSAVKPCACQKAKKLHNALERAEIPLRYKHCTLDNFQVRFPGSDPSLATALMQARAFVRNYLSSDSQGMLLVGTVGTGKTHLAVGALRAVIEKGFSGLFCDYRKLMKLVQNSYNPQANTTEMGLLAPVASARVLVLDDLGAVRPTEWVRDTISVVLNDRYNEKLTTIITTNHAFEEAAASTNAEPTLGYQIGDRMLSRLREMCTRVQVSGADYRASGHCL